MKRSSWMMMQRGRSKQEEMEQNSGRAILDAYNRHQFLSRNRRIKYLDITQENANQSHRKFPIAILLIPAYKNPEWLKLSAIPQNIPQKLILLAFDHTRPDQTRLIIPSGFETAALSSLATAASFVVSSLFSAFSSAFSSSTLNFSSSPAAAEASLFSSFFFCDSAIS
nr:hypothetical protein Iba_chr08bCG9210 [Ipomoea batatas]